MTARLFQPARNAMQQGRAKTGSWTLEFPATTAREIEPLMGWTAATGTMTQVQLHFDTKEAGLAYAAKQGLMVEVEDPAAAKPKARPKSYAENFATDRILRWTH